MILNDKDKKLMEDYAKRHYPFFSERIWKKDGTLLCRRPGPPRIETVARIKLENVLKDEENV